MEDSLRMGRAVHFLLVFNIIIGFCIAFVFPYHVEFEKNIAIAQPVLAEVSPETAPAAVAKNHATPTTIKKGKTIVASVSGYTSRPQETDDDPFITASGDHVYDGGVACPSWLAFGDKVLISGKVYTCNDRMNVRYRQGNYFDIWFSDLDAALSHGRQQLEVVILR